MSFNPPNVNGQASMANSQPQVPSSDFVANPVTGQSAQTATINNILTTVAGSTATDVSNYRSATVQIVSTGTGGTFIFEGSNDNTTFFAVPFYFNSFNPNPLAAAAGASGGSNLYHLALPFRYFRCRIATTITGGSIQAISTFFNMPLSTTTSVVGNTGTSGINAAVTTGQTAHSSAATLNPVRVGGIVVPTTAATQDATLVAGDASNLPITTGYQAIVKEFGSAETDFTFNGVIANSTTPSVFKAASGTANIRNYVSLVTLNSDTLGTASEVVIKDGLVTASSQTIAANTITTGTHDFKIGDAVLVAASTITGLTAGTIYYVLTVPSVTTFTLSAAPNGTTLAISGSSVTATMNRILFRTKVQTTSLAPIQVNFITPLRGAPNTTLDITMLTASTGNLYYNVSGYTGF